MRWSVLVTGTLPRMMQFATLPTAAAGEWLPAQSLSIGRRSRDLKNRHLLGRIWRVIVGVIAVFAASLAWTVASRGLGSAELLLTALSAILVAALLLRYPRLMVPPRAILALLPLGEIAGSAQLWLETRRQALPPRAARVLDQIGIQLDALALQLDHLGESRVQADTVRKLVGRELPEIVCAYITASRGDPVAGVSREVQVIEQLSLCSHHIALLTRRIAGHAICR